MKPAQLAKLQKELADDGAISIFTSNGVPRTARLWGRMVGGWYMRPDFQRGTRRTDVARRMLRDWERALRYLLAIDYVRKHSTKELYRLIASGECRHCGCTDAEACEEPCSWFDSDHTICTNPTCLDKERNRVAGGPR